MRVLVDADACPVKARILEVCARHSVEVVMIASHAHEVTGGTVMKVESSPQAVDIALFNEARAGDVVVTGDYGLACMVLGRGARALSFRGQEFHDGNIDGLMASRHAAAKTRRAGGRTRGPKALTEGDRRAFAAALDRMLDAIPPSPEALHPQGFTSPTLHPWGCNERPDAGASGG